MEEMSKGHSDKSDRVFWKSNAIGYQIQWQALKIWVELYTAVWHKCLLNSWNRVPRPQIDDLSQFGKEGQRGVSAGKGVEL
jgi:hypothetical protein